jgi:predicted dehydrogenase
MGDRPVRVGIVGAGANTRARHIPGLRALAGVEIVGVVNRTRDSSDRVAAECHIPRVFDTWKDLVASPEIDAVVIGTWPYLHAPVTVAALAAGKHVLCEARMAATADEAREMWRAARENPNLVAQVVPAPFTLGADRTIRRLIAEGYLGRLLVVEVRAGGVFLDASSPLHWRQDANLSGINIMSLGIWYESVMRWVGEAARVTAMGKIFLPLRRNADGVMVPVRIPDHVDVLADLACGAQAHFQISGVTGLAGAPEAFLFGDKATLRFSESRLYGGTRDAGELKEIPIPLHEQGGWRVEEEFINAIRGKEPVTRTTFADGVKYMNFTQAVADSLAGGQVIPLPVG